MAKNNVNQNFIIVEINPTTHVTKAIPYDKVYIYDNVLFSDFYNQAQQAFAELDTAKQTIIALEEVVNSLREALENVALVNKSMNTRISQNTAEIKALKDNLTL